MLVKYFHYDYEPYRIEQLALIKDNEPEWQKSFEEKIVNNLKKIDKEGTATVQKFASEKIVKTWFTITGIYGFSIFNILLENTSPEKVKLSFRNSSRFNEIELPLEVVLQKVLQNESSTMKCLETFNKISKQRKEALKRIKELDNEFYSLADSL